MRALGTLSSPLNSTSPCVALVVFDAATMTPSFALMQDNEDDIPFLRWGGAVLDVAPLLHDCALKSTAPQGKAGGLRRNVLTVSIVTTHEKGYPYYNAAISRKMYQCGQRPDAVVFALVAFDRSKQSHDLKTAWQGGIYSIDSGLSWYEVEGITKVTLVDVLTNDEYNVGATDEEVPDLFFIFNPDLTGTIMPVVYGQVPRIKLTNAFPTISLRKLSNSVSGILYSAYTPSDGPGTVIVLEVNTQRSSLLRQLVTLGGIVRIKMHDGETIAGTLSYDSVANTVSLTITARNTYYAASSAHTYAGGSQATDTWTGGTYSSLNFLPTQTYVQNGADIILDPQGYMQSDLDFYDSGTTGFDKPVANVNVVLKGLATATSAASISAKAGTAITSDTVIHELWRDPSFPLVDTYTSVSAFYNMVSNASAPNGTVTVWGDPSFEFMKFSPTLRPVRFFFNNPATGAVSCLLTANHVGAVYNVGMIYIGSIVQTQGMAGGDTGKVATGQIKFRAGLQPVSATYVTVSDGTLVKTFEFTNTTPGAGHIAVAIAGSALGTMANLIAAINASGLDLVASSNVNEGIVGDPWQMVNLDPASVDWAGYVRNGFSHFDPSHVYVQGEGRLIQVPSQNVVGVTDIGTFYGLTNMAKVELTAAPLDLGIGALTNDIYVDALFRTGVNEALSQRVLLEILQTSPLLSQLTGPTLAGVLPTLAWMPYMGWYCKEATQVSKILDRWVFQAGASAVWRGGLFDLQQVAWNNGTAAIVTIDGADYLRPLLPYLDDSVMLENTANVAFGKIITNVDGNGKEYLPLYVKLTYGGWEDPFYKPTDSQVNKARKIRDVLFTYQFDLINDQDSFNYAAGLLLSLGHAAGLTSCERRLSTKCNLQALGMDVLDPVVFKDFPLISSADETDAVLDVDGMPLYPVAPDGKQFLMGAVGVVETLDFDMTTPVPMVAITAKVSQFFTNAQGLNIYAPPFPPAGPSSPSSDPNSAPGGGGKGTGAGGGGEFPTGGMDGYLPLKLGEFAAVIIDSLTPYTVTCTVSVDGGAFASKGFHWDAAVIGPEAAGCAITMDGTGVFPAKTDSTPYVPIVYNLTIDVDYRVFASYGLSLFNTTVVVRITRTLGVDDEGFPLEDYKDVIIAVNRLEITGVDGS